ncbi:MAG: hypothetical protein K2J83_04800 [Clostridia bacterium]|nr:hypothetical protein [Clostridia bacterium]
MNIAMVIIAAAGFAVSIFPIHVFNYIYINTEEKYGSVNVTVFRFIRLFNANTVKNSPGKMQINGKEKKLDFNNLKLSAYKIFNMLCIYKVVQLSDYGMQNERNAYAALAQNGVTTAAYKFLQINGNYVKLRNYTILNEEHSSIRYYAKAVTVINLLVVTKIIFYVLMEKLNVLKN